ncbi:hypothetical protein OOZ15_17550 [Galbibacter sp. EGI 63066]|uniref:hypothetical protein n=1 Tax=Galbibacter sp. EGI 63066 TaxID=2993559 RepID=UPI00224946FE|nr:hypothetical protein [Galbibacter sp. EGI 63066]MCX2681763.1 hypothetical protein [Galbibacter sp. EGI 63066]
MKNFLIASLLIVSLTSGNIPEVSVVTDVYICNSANGKKYHYKKTCRGLNACKAKIKKLSLKDAKKRGKTLCGWED